jgi:hypothetical protein
MAPHSAHVVTPRGVHAPLGKAVRRGGRVAEGARLESVFTGNRNVGSNPTPSATSEQNCERPA